MSEMSNATNSEDRLESILDQVRVLKAKYDERAEVTGENFNVFSILHMESDEVKTHSAIIAELLNPHGSHSQGTLFLKLFLEKLLKDELPNLKCSEDDLRDEYLKKFEVGVEVSFESFEKKDGKEQMKRSQIDILIESSDVCIVIENKIYARDQERQLGRYYEYALDTGKRLGIIYLTLEGDKPKEFTLYGGDPNKFYGEGKISPRRRLREDTVICLSYKDFIVKWVDNCIKEAARIPQIRETLHQYQMTVKKLIGQPINRRYAMALKSTLLKDENFNLIPDLEVAISEAKDAFQCDFWTKLEEKIKARKEELNIEDKDLRYEVYVSGLGIVKGKEETIKCINNRPKGQSPGLTFGFPQSEDENYEVVFRIADDRDQHPLYYGFVLCEKRSHKRVEINDAKRREYPHLDKYTIDDGGKDESAGWLAYRYFKNPEISFTNFTFVTEHQEGKREDFIKDLVEELVKEVCKVIEKALNKNEAR